MKTESLFVALALVLAGAPAGAQWTKSVSVNTVYDNNAFRNYQGLSDYVTQVSAYLARDGGNDTFQSRFFYRGGYYLFADFAQRNFHHHQAGLALAFSLDQRGDLLNAGANAGLRLNRELYSYYDFATVSAFANMKLYLSPATVAQAGYRLRTRWYSNLPEFSNTEHFFFARFTHFFPSRTTLIIETDYGRKIYLQAVSDGSGLSDGGQHDIRRHDGGMGHMGGGWWNGNSSWLSGKYGVAQAVALLRLAQSLGSSTGLSVQFLYRGNPAQTARYLAGQVSGYSNEDELFDDPYGYESRELRGALTRLLPWGMTLRAGTEAQWKDYVRRPALDLSGQPLSTGENRADRRFAAWIGLSRSFTVGRRGPIMTLVGEFNWFDNRSNDAYYRYSAATFTIGVSTEF